MLEDIFGHKEAIDLSKSTCHSGGATGSDTYWADLGKIYDVVTRAYSYKTKNHPIDKVEISEEDYLEGVDQVNKANHVLGRFGINKYMNLLARNWAQVKYSDQIYAIGYIVEPGGRGKKGYYNKSKYQQIDGGTGYAVQMGIQNDKDVFIFDQTSNKWYQWSYTVFRYKEIDTPIITSLNFAGIGTRDITNEGIEAIENIYKKTYDEYNK